jgi:4-azaleucine resistance transporter AzlC
MCNKNTKNLQKNQRERKMKELKKAFPLTIPVMAGYIFLGITYGILMVTNGFPIWLPVLTAAVIYTGSMEFLMVEILSSSFAPLSAFLTAFMVGARHLFYGLSMLKKYNGCGRSKFYLIYTCSDETFALNYNADPTGLNKSRFYTIISLLDQLYWITGSLIGSIFGTLITFNTKGLDFVMTAMFLSIFADQWLKDKKEGKTEEGLLGEDEKKSLPRRTIPLLWLRYHLPEIIGVLASLVCLLIFGSNKFIIPSMILMLALLTVFRPFIEGKEDGRKEGGKKR